VPRSTPDSSRPLDKFGIESAEIVFEFDAAKNQMMQKGGRRERFFTTEK
jgi:hypothetical protein